MRQIACLILCGSILFGAAGCISAPRSGDLEAVRPVSDAPRAGNVYLLRGFIGVFSTGIDSLGAQMGRVGINAQVFQESQASALARTIRDTYAREPRHEPIVLIGHSYGADSVIRIARELDRADIPVELLVTLDAVTPPPIPKNVRNALNLYQSNAFWDRTPFLRGVPVSADRGFTGRLDNFDIRTDRPDLMSQKLDHFNIEKQPQIHEEVIGHVLLVCPPRHVWVAEHAPPSREAQARPAGGRVANGASVDARAARPTGHGGRNWAD